MTDTNLYRTPVIAQASDPAIAARLQRIWETPAGLRGWLTTVDHKIIGIRYLITAFAFLLLGGMEALVMRVQLAHANQHVLTSEQYNQLFTMHGITMIFLYALPVLSGFSNYLWPLMLGSRDMAFPRLNALSYWIFLFSGLFIYASFLAGDGPNSGWFNYVPYASLSYNPGQGIDFYALGMIMLGVSTTVGSINFIVTLFRTRAPGMSINRVPILVWGTLTASVGNLLAVPAVSLAFLMLWMDRQFGTHFFDTTGGGSPLLWQHLFWMFGHPWVYAIVLPAMGIISDGLPTFCRRPLVGYTLVALSTVATMFIGFGVWVHHMFATGIPALSLSFFSSASFVVAIPSSVAVFAWIATIWTGRPVFKTPFLFFASFVLLFVIGGVSGFMTAAVPLDLQLTDTYFIVAHLHYVLLGINVFPVIGGIYYWFPKMTGRLMSERLGRWNFWVMFIGFNLAFFPMHVSGLLGMPRRIYTYPTGYGWDTLNFVTTLGAFLFAIGVLLFVVNVSRSLRQGEKAGPNPWDAPTLEWAVASPPPPYNFTVIPTVASRHPLWEDRLGEEGSGRSRLEQGPLLDHGRETLGTTALDGEPDVILKMPDDSFAPIVMALLLTALCYSALRQSWWLCALSALGIFVCLLLWLWPQAALAQTVQHQTMKVHHD
jgi:cytochrome c oxidase subunit I